LSVLVCSLSPFTPLILGLCSFCPPSLFIPVLYIRYYSLLPLVILRPSYLSTIFICSIPITLSLSIHFVW
jgi:hypothetical protein